MSLEGTATGKTLVGSIQKCDVLTISAYGIAVKNGFQGTEEEWLDSLNGGLITVDKQLYRSGHAADAAVTGKKFSELDQKLDFERTRIDNLSTLEEGSTTGDAELQDIRVGYDGTVYENAGKAVREQAKPHSSVETVRWNQFVGGKSTYKHNGISIDRQGTLVTITGTATADAYPHMAVINGLSGGHTVLLRLPRLSGVANISVYEYDAATAAGNAGFLKNQTVSNGAVLRFALHPDTAKLWICPVVTSGKTVDGSDYLHLFDLTEMFGEGKEPTADEFFRLYPQKDYAYCKPAKAPAPYLSTICLIHTVRDDLENFKPSSFYESGADKIGIVSAITEDEQKNTILSANEQSALTSEWQHIGFGISKSKLSGKQVLFKSVKLVWSDGTEKAVTPTIFVNTGFTYTGCTYLQIGKLYDMDAVFANYESGYLYFDIGTSAAFDKTHFYQLDSGKWYFNGCAVTVDGSVIDKRIAVAHAKTADMLNNGLTGEEIESRLNESSSNLTGKKFLVMGDSLTAANSWQKELTAKGATYTNHALGGAGIVTIVDGGSNSNGSLSALTVADVTDKDAIIFFGGTNNQGGTHGAVGDIYPERTTVAGYMQYAINKIYALLTEAGNLNCRVMVVTPYCFGASAYNPDAFARNGFGLAQIIEDVANYNGVPVWNAYKNSGINPTTLAVWGASATDHVHLNSVGYAHLGKLIAEFADRNVLD